MDLERLDKILLTEEDARKILHWERENRDNYDTFDYPLKEGVIVLRQHLNFGGKQVELANGLYFRVTDTGIYFSNYDWNDKVKMVSTFVAPGTDMTHLDIKTHWGSPALQRMTEKLAQKEFEATMFLFFATMLYMNHHREFVERSEQKRVVTKKPKAGKTAKRFTKLTSVQYVLNFEKEETETRKYERHTDSWTQRGFYRHYKKSGLIKWINPQVKGARNVQPEPKTYKP